MFATPCGSCAGILGSRWWLCSLWRRALVQKIGIRMAVGADRGDVLRLFIGRELRLVLVGMAAGAAGALILTRTLSSLSHLLYGIGSSDPLTFGIVSVVLMGVAALACYIPARRAARVDPMVALRNE
jgi:putative ABC transport system permease protein